MWHFKEISSWPFIGRCVIWVMLAITVNYSGEYQAGRILRGGKVIQIILNDGESYKELFA